MADLTLHCKRTQKPFIVREWEQALLTEWGLPLPDICPEERHRRRMSHRNARKIYSAKCASTGRNIISMYHPDQELMIYCQEAWWSDSWDAMDYGRDFDFSRPFFEQLQELRRVVPRAGLMNINGENSDYCNITTDNKNCYLVFGGDFNEDCMYSQFCFKSRDLLDVYWVTESELCYDCVNCERSYRLLYSQNSVNCSDSAFLFECRNCKNCFGCVGLVGKEYHFFNRPYPKEEYEKLVKQYRLDTWTGVQHMKNEFARFRLAFPHRAVHFNNAENSTGDFLSNVKDAENCFFLESNVEQVKDIFMGGWNLKTSFSCSHIGHKSERCYEIIGTPGAYDCRLSLFSWNSQNVMYCDSIDNLKDCFGCVGLRRKQYCILNKQYSREEYEALLPRIIEHMKQTGEWGQMFPEEMSLFAYNESVAQDFFPLSKKEVAERGLRWRDNELHEGYRKTLPDSINEVADDIIQFGLACEESNRPYRVIPKEVNFYRKMKTPLPHFAPETRNSHRLNRLNPIQVWERECAKCQSSIQTTYAPDRPEIVYCEACYLETAY